MPLRTAVLFFLLLVCLPLYGDTPPRWLEVKTPHFIVITDGGEAQARRIAVQFERMHALFAKLLPGSREDTAAKVVVLAFRNRKGFEAVEPEAYLQKHSLELAGLFLSREDKSFILVRLDAPGEHPYGTVYHEYTHYMVRHVTSLPLWLNEGLAQFYQNTEIDATTARTGEPSVNDVYLLRGAKLIPLSTLFAVDHTSPYYHEEDKGGIFYAEAWALTHYLMIQDRTRGTDLLQNYAKRVLEGEDSVTAAEHAFGSLQELGTALEGYIQHGTYMMLKTPLPNTVKEADFDVQPLATADADAVRAEVLVEDGRTAEGRTLAESVLADSSENTTARETLGLLALREGHLQEARRWYGEAVAKHSTSYLSYLYFGTLSMQFGNDATEAGRKSIDSSLHEALHLNPDCAPAAAALAHFDARHDQSDDAVRLFARAIGLDPANVDYRLDAAQVRMQRKEWVNAVSILHAADKVAKTSADHERIGERLKSAENFRTQMAGADASSSGSRTVGDARGAIGSDGRATGTVRDSGGHVLQPVASKDPGYTFPTGPANGPRHTLKGVLHGVSCFYPKGLTLSVGDLAEGVVLYSNDMYGIQFTAANFTPGKELNPCREFEGFKASVTYAEVQAAPAAGEIVSIELTK